LEDLVVDELSKFNKNSPPPQFIKGLLLVLSSTNGSGNFFIETIELV